MSANKVTELFQSRGDFTELPPVLRGAISGAVGSGGSLISAPEAMPTVGSQENLLWVLAGEYSLVNPLGPCRWTPLWGKTLPAHGAEVVLMTDNRGIQTVTWWQGEYS
jgi:hypothetical protein